MNLKVLKDCKDLKNHKDLKDFKSGGYYENGESVGQKGKGNY